MSEAQALHQQLHPEITYLIEDTRDLVSPPQVHFTLLEELNDPASTVKKLAEVIAMDPALTTRLLRIVNSPYYGQAGRVDTLSRAVTIVGNNELYNLVIAVSAISVFSRLPGSLVNMDSFWRHSVYTAMVSRELAKCCNFLHTERLFIAGLLHDVGSLLLYNERPDTMRDLLMAAQGDEEVLFHLELNRLGFSHAEVGSGIMHLWQLPDALCNAIAAHHTPLDVPEPCREASVLYVADFLANRSEHGISSGESQPLEDIDESILETLGLGMEELQPVTERATQSFDESIATFLPNW